MNDLLSAPSLIVLLAVLGFFGWHGLRRGAQLEAVLTLSVVGMRFVVDRWGTEVIRLSNNLYRGVQFVLNGGLNRDDPAQVLLQVRQTPPLVAISGQDTYLLLLFIAMVASVYWVSQRIWGMARSWVGGLLGMLNGYLLMTFLLPFLGGRAPAPSSLARSTAEHAAGLVGQTPVGHWTGQGGTALLLAVIVGVVLLAARSLQRGGG